jgi:hypothetical protein
MTDSQNQNMDSGRISEDLTAWGIGDCVVSAD